MKLLLAILALAAFACTQANSFQTPVHFTTLHNVGNIRGLKNGRRHFSPKIFGGMESYPGRLPYQAGLTIDNSNFCGATIIHESYVLTSAFCANGGQTFNVFVGDIRLGKDASPKESLISHEAIIHENYDPNGFSNDIALIRLPYSLTFDEYIDKIDIAASYDFPRTYGTISGWGQTYEGGDLSPILRLGVVTIITNEDCQAVYGDLITDSHICTVPQNGTGFCGGDFGGPLAGWYNSVQKALLGISSFINTKGCGVGPDGYTRVYSFIDWINSHIN